MTYLYFSLPQSSVWQHAITPGENLRSSVSVRLIIFRERRPLNIIWKYYRNWTRNYARDEIPHRRKFVAKNQGKYTAINYNSEEEDEIVRFHKNEIDRLNIDTPTEDYRFNMADHQAATRAFWRNKGKLKDADGW